VFEQIIAHECLGCWNGYGRIVALNRGQERKS
jgi:hypothetical protein